MRDKFLQAPEIVVLDMRIIMLIKGILEEVAIYLKLVRIVIIT